MSKQNNMKDYSIKRGEFLRLKREQAGLTQEALSELIGMSERMLGYYEEGRDMKISTFNKICTALDIVDLNYMNLSKMY